MNLEELLKALELEGEKANTLKKEFNAKEKELNQVNSKVEKLEEQAKKDKEMLDKLEIIKKSFKLDLETDDLDKALDDIKDSFSKEVKNTEDSKELNRELTKANRELEKVKKDLATANESLEAEKAERIKGIKNSEILKSLNAQNVIKADQWVGKFFNEVTFDEGKLYMKDEAGKEISLDDGIAEWAKANPEFVKVNTKGGVGSGKGGSTSENGVSDFMKTLLGSTESKETKSLGEMFG